MIPFHRLLKFGELEERIVIIGYLNKNSRKFFFLFVVY